MQDSLAQNCADLIRSAKHIAVLTGAGISTNAGIPDFRGPQGLYITKKYDPEKVFDIQHFRKDPRPFFEFAKDFIQLESQLQPTYAHQFLAKLELQNKLKGIITQNIDSLHQLAGSKNVYEMHGSFWKNFCLDCREEYSYDQMKDFLLKDETPRCSCQGIIKPDIVFFGENVKYLPESLELAQQADLFFVIGTSCVVYPAAMVPEHTQGKMIIVNFNDVKARFNNVELIVKEDADIFFQKVSNLIND